MIINPLVQPLLHSTSLSCPLTAGPSTGPWRQLPVPRTSRLPDGHLQPPRSAASLPNFRLDISASLLHQNFHCFRMAVDDGSSLHLSKPFRMMETVTSVINNPILLYGITTYSSTEVDRTKVTLTKAEDCKLVRAGFKAPNVRCVLVSLPEAGRMCSV